MGISYAAKKFLVIAMDLFGFLFIELLINMWCGWLWGIGWRTMLVVPELEKEVQVLASSRDTRKVNFFSFFLFCCEILNIYLFIYLYMLCLCRNCNCLGVREIRLKTRLIIWSGPSSMLMYPTLLFYFIFLKFCDYIFGLVWFQAWESGCWWKGKDQCKAWGAWGAAGTCPGSSSRVSKDLPPEGKLQINK